MELHCMKNEPACHSNISLSPEVKHALYPSLSNTAANSEAILLWQMVHHRKSEPHTVCAKCHLMCAPSI